MNKTIPLLDMKSPYRELKDELDEAYQRVMESGWYILGDEVVAFEQEFAEYCGVRHCVGVGNGLEQKAGKREQEQEAGKEQERGSKSRKQLAIDK